MVRKFLPFVLILALAACGAPKPPETTSSLVARAARGEADAATELVVRLGSQVSFDERGQAYRGLLDAGKRAEKQVMEAVRDRDPARREHALALAANLKAEGAYEAAREALEDPSFPRAHAAAWALGELVDPRAVEALSEALGRLGPGLAARECVRALSKFGPASLDGVLPRYSSLNPEIKGYVVRMLGEMRDMRGLPVILGALSDPALRADAVWALGTFGKAAADAAPVMTYLADSDHRVRIEACRSVGLLGIKASLKTLDAMRRGDREPVVREWAARGMGLITGEAEKYLAKDGTWKEPDNIYH